MRRAPACAGVRSVRRSPRVRRRVETPSWRWQTGTWLGRGCPTPPVMSTRRPRRRPARGPAFVHGRCRRPGTVEGKDRTLCLREAHSVVPFAAGDEHVLVAQSRGDLPNIRSRSIGGVRGCGPDAGQRVERAPRRRRERSGLERPLKISTRPSLRSSRANRLRLRCIVPAASSRSGTGSNTSAESRVGMVGCPISRSSWPPAMRTRPSRSVTALAHPRAVSREGAADESFVGPVEALNRGVARGTCSCRRSAARRRGDLGSGGIEVIGAGRTGARPIGVQAGRVHGGHAVRVPGARWTQPQPCEVGTSRRSRPHMDRWRNRICVRRKPDRVPLRRACPLRRDGTHHLPTDGHCRAEHMRSLCVGRANRVGPELDMHDSG